MSEANDKPASDKVEGEAPKKVNDAIDYARRVADHESRSGKVHDFWGSLRTVLLHMSGAKMPEPPPPETDPVPVAAKDTSTPA
jgi:hypothetical protein